MALKFDYLVIDLDKDYQWTVIIAPSQKYLWIMARTPSISDKLYSEILNSIESKKYNIESIKKMPQVELQSTKTSGIRL